MIFKKGLVIFIIDNYNIIIRKGNKKEQLFTRNKE